MNQNPVNLLRIRSSHTSCSEVILSLHPGRRHHLNGHIIQAVYLTVDCGRGRYGHDPLESFRLLHNLIHGWGDIQHSPFFRYASLIHSRHLFIKSFHEVGCRDDISTDTTRISGQFCMKFGITIGIFFRDSLFGLKGVLYVCYG